MGITGASGFVGGVLVKEALARNHSVVAFSRTPERKIPGCTETRGLDRHPDLSGIDAMVNLAGESIFGYWTAAKKRRIRESRVHATRSMVDGIPGSPVRILINASAVGFYGDTGDVVVDENAAPGEGFLGEVAAAWEGEASRAESQGVRVVCLRLGIVLGRGGGAMKMMSPIFRLGLGGRLGSGKQGMSCIHAEDVARLVLFCIERESLSGPVNAVMPEFATNAEFTRTLASVLHRPAVFAVQAWTLRLATGEFSEVLLGSQCVRPSRALEAGFEWRYPNLPAAIKAAL